MVGSREVSEKRGNWQLGLPLGIGRAGAGKRDAEMEELLVCMLLA